MQKQSVLLLICSGFRKITRRIRILAATTAMWLLLLLLQLLPSPDLPCRRARTFLSTIMVVSVRVRAIALSTTTSCLQNIMSQDVCLHISIITQAFSSERLSYIQMFFIFYIKQRLRYFQDPTMILSNMSCTCPMRCNQHYVTPCFPARFQNDWCTYTSHIYCWEQYQ